MTAQAVPAAPGRSGLRVSAAAAVVAVAAQTFVGLVLYGFLIRKVGAESVGVWVALLAVGLLACTADMGFSHVLIRRLALASTGTERRTAHEWLETLVWGAAVLTGAALLSVYLSFGWWSSWMKLAPHAHAEAVRWLPFVLVGLWLNRVAETLGGALDGQLRFVERSAAATCTLVAGLVLTVVSVPTWGMDAAAVVFVVQNALLFCANFVLLARGTPGVRWLRPRIRTDILREAVRYGMSVQALVLCYLVLESGIKLFLAGGGHLTAVSYFDLTFRIGKGVRSLLASALRVLVPRLAPATQTADGSAVRRSIYARSFGALLVVALPIFVGLLASTHLIAWVVVGRDEPIFVEALMFALLPWLAYSLTDPALNLSLASGRLGWPLRGHLATVAAAALLAAWFGSRTAYVGLYAIVLFAMLLGCVITLVGVHRDENLPWRLLDPSRTALAVLGGVACGLLGTFAPELLHAWNPVLRWMLVAFAYVGFLTLMAWHPSARSLLRRA